MVSRYKKQSKKGRNRRLPIFFFLSLVFTSGFSRAKPATSALPETKRQKVAETVRPSNTSSFYKLSRSLRTSGDDVESLPPPPRHTETIFILSRFLTPSFCRPEKAPIAKCCGSHLTPDNYGNLERFTCLFFFNFYQGPCSQNGEHFLEHAQE